MSPSPNALARVREDLQVVIDRDPAVRGCRVALLAPHLPALWMHRGAHRLHKRGLQFTARLLTVVGRAVSGGVDIHPGATLGPRLFIDHGSAVVIGEDAVIGADVTLYHQVTIGAVGWWKDRNRRSGERRHPTIGDRVVIGVGASVLGPVSVGDDCVIGAHALVVDDVPSGHRVRVTRSEMTAWTTESGMEISSKVFPIDRRESSGTTS